MKPQQVPEGAAVADATCVIVPEDERLAVFDGICAVIARALTDGEVLPFEAARREVWWRVTGARWATTPRRILDLVVLSLDLSRAPRFTREVAP